MDGGSGKLACAAYRMCRARARLPEVLAAWSGKTFNTAAISRQLGVSRPTVVAYVSKLERVDLVRLLPFYGGKRRPLLSLCSSPRGGLMESIIGKLCLIVPGSGFFWWKTGRTRQVDLIADVGSERIGFCFPASPLARRRDWLPLDIAARRGVIRRGFLLHTGTRAFVVASAVQALPADSFVREMDEWIFRRQSVRDGREARARINSQCLARGAGHR